MKTRRIRVILCFVVIACALMTCACGSNQAELSSAPESLPPAESEASAEISLPERTGLTYEINADGTTCTVTGQDAESKNEAFVTIPETIDGFTVTAVGKKAFYGNKKLTNITLPGTVKTIGPNAFAGCSALETVTLSEGLEEIQFNAFNASGIVSVSLPQSVKTIAEGAFRYCGKLTEVTFGGNIDVIGKKAFAECKALAGVTFPAGPREISERAFSGCESLVTVDIGEGNEIIADWAFEYSESLKTIKLPSSLKEFGKNVFHARSRTDIDPDTGYFGYWVDTGLTVYFAGTIEQWDSVMTQNTLCDGVADLYIAGTLLHDLSAYNSDTFNTRAFSHCKSLKKLVLSDKIQIIGSCAFEYDVSLEKITFGSDLRIIANQAFSYCEKVKSLTLPSTLKEIGMRAFSGCKSLKDIYYAGTVSEWQKITKGGFWNINTPPITVHCSDGEITETPDE